MDRSTAEKLMKNLLALSEPLNLATAATSEIGDKEEQAKIRRPIGKIMSIVYVELIRPIINQYPELDPDKDRHRE